VISCSEAVRRLWEYLDHDLGDEDRKRVEGHLALCRRCCGEAEFAAALGDLLRSSAGPDLPGEIEQHLVGFLESLQERRRDPEPEAP
jgi:anti-sigma factor (TIGR02949 family)